MSSKKAPEYIRSKDVAYVLDCCPDDVVVLAREGKLKGHKHGRYWRFALSDVLEFRRRRDRSAKRKKK